MEKVIEALRAFQQAQDERYNLLVQRLDALEAQVRTQQETAENNRLAGEESLRRLSDELQAIRQLLAEAQRDIPAVPAEAPQAPVADPQPEPADDEVEIEFIYDEAELPEPLPAPEEPAAEPIAQPQPEIPAEPAPETAPQPAPAHEDHPQAFSAQVGTPVDDIRKAISLGDRFLFVRELFANNGEELQKTIDILNGLSSLNEALAWIDAHQRWDKESKAYELFVNVLRRRFQ